MSNEPTTRGDPFEFVARVPEGGFRWEDGNEFPAGKPSRVLVEVGEGGEVAAQETEVFGTEPNLFVEFADLTESESAVLGFANRYGQLLPLHDAQSIRGDYGSSFAAWATRIRLMREILELWTAVAAGNWSRLREAFCVEAGRGWYAWPSVASAPKRARLGVQLETDRGGRITVTALRSAATKLVADTVNRWLYFAQPRLVPYGSDFQIRFEPNTLDAALWLQLARFIEGRRSYERCAECRAAFVVSPQISRSDRRYCSDRCRMKAYRGRKSVARKLAAKGKNASQIAKDLGSDVKTVRAWIGRKR